MAIPTSVRLGGLGIGDTLVLSSLYDLHSMLDELRTILDGSGLSLERGEPRIVGLITLREGVLTSVLWADGEVGEVGTEKSVGVDR